MTVLVRLSRAEADDCWPLIQDKITDALGRSNTRRLEASDVYEGLLTGRWQAWLVMDVQGIRAVVITEIYTTPNSKVANIFICTGEGREDWQGHLEEIEQRAREAGCTHLSMTCRPGWSRMLKQSGYRETHRIMEKGLTNV